MESEKPNKDLQDKLKNLQEKPFKPEIAQSIKEKQKYVNKPVKK